MRKICLFIIGLILIPNIVLADVGAPIFNSYDALVINDAAYLCEYNSKDETCNNKIKLEKGEKLTINYESYLNGIWYGEVYYDEEFYYVKLEDLIYSDAKILINESMRLEKNMKGYVYTHGTYLYNGPSRVYSKVSEDEIPIGTVLEYLYANTDLNYMDLLNWVYVKYNGVYGWVCISPSYFSEVPTIASIYKAEDDNIKGKVLLYKDVVNLYSLPNTDSKKIQVNIPKFSELEFKYYDTSFYEWVYVSYNGVSGWLNGENFSPKEEKKLLVINEDGTFLYDNYNLSGNSIHIDNNEELELNYLIDDNIIQVSYKNKPYWLKYEYGDFASESNNKLMAIKKDIALYEKPNSKIPIETININEFTAKYEVLDYYYLENKNIKGWILKTDVAYGYDYEQVFIKGDTNIYDNINKDNTIGKLNYFDKVQILYIYYGEEIFYYIENENYKGWICESIFGNPMSGKYIVLEDTKIYDVNNFNKEIGIIKKDEKITPMFDYINEENENIKYYYVEVNDLKGWVKYDVLNEIIEEDIISIADTKKEPIIAKKLTKEEIIGYSLIGVSCLVLTAMVLLLLINKKKESKK